MKKLQCKQLNLMIINERKDSHYASSLNTPPYNNLLCIGKTKAYIKWHKSILPDLRNRCFGFPLRINKNNKLKYIKINDWLENQNVSRQYQDPCFFARKILFPVSCGRFLSVKNVNLISQSL